MTRIATTARRLGSGLTTLLLVVVALGAVAYIAPSFFGYERYVITGGSMSGTFEKGSIAFEKPVPSEDLVVGDVITYLPPPDSGTTMLVTHRIIAIEPGENGARVFTTQGDANADPDPWKFSLIDTQQPVVEATVPYVGHLFIALADRDTRVMVIGLPAALIALVAVAELARALFGKSEDDEATEAAAASRVPAPVGPHPLPLPGRRTHHA